MAITASTKEYEKWNAGDKYFDIANFVNNPRATMYVIKVKIGAEATDKYATGGIPVTLKLRGAKNIDFAGILNHTYAHTAQVVGEKIKLLAADGTEVAADTTTGVQSTEYDVLVLARY